MSNVLDMNEMLVDADDDTTPLEKKQVDANIEMFAPQTTRS